MRWAPDFGHRIRCFFEKRFPTTVLTVDLRHGWALHFLEAFPFQGRELVYSDPPYLLTTRRPERRYRHDFDDATHVALLTLLKSLDCQVMISGYPSRLYATQLAGWRSMSLQVNDHAAVVTETVWFNFEPDWLLVGQFESAPPPRTAERFEFNSGRPV